MQEDVPEYHYVVEAMPPSRVGRRWRWQLFRGERLLAGGWNLGERRAVLALRKAASRAVHERHGVHVLRPDAAVPDRPFLPGTTVLLHCGALTCLLVPREAYVPEATAA